MNVPDTDIADVLGIDAERLEAAAERVNEDPLTFARVAVRFRMGSGNEAEFAQYVEVEPR